MPRFHLQVDIMNEVKGIPKHVDGAWTLENLFCFCIRTSHCLYAGSSPCQQAHLLPPRCSSHIT